MDPDIRFPGESSGYRRARNALLEAEAELRASIERVAEQRRALPAGGPVPDDYLFEEAAEGGGEVRFSELFAPGKDTLVVYSFMFPRYSRDTEAGGAGRRDRAAAARRDPVPLVHVDPRRSRRCGALAR